MTGRRTFLKSGGGAVIVANIAPRVLREARDIVRRGELGTIGMCRVGSSELDGAISFVLDQVQPACVIDMDPGVQGITVLGSTATLVITSNGWQLFAG